MIQLKSDDACEVCGKCAISCPRGAIHYELGKCGNYYPVIDKETCVECHVCERVCTQETDFNSDYLSSQYYIGYYRDGEIRENSSSGGIFSAFAIHILHNRGQVIGAAYDPCVQSVKHIAVSREEDLGKLRKSKYVQSDWIGVCQTVKKAIYENQWILVSGTPCQVATLVEQFGNYEKIFFVDLFCHGVTMAGIFRDYIHAIGGDVENIDFRHRKVGEEINFTMRILRGNGNTVVEEWGQNMLCGLFVNSCTLKPSCFTCRYAAKQHKSDITIGDFADWRDYAQHYGIDYPLASVISVNSEKGMQLFQTIQDKLVYCRLENRDIIASYYKKHEQKRGAWGYERDLWEKFNSIYQDKGFSIAAIELLYKKELELIQRIDTTKREEEELIIYGAGVIAKRVKWMIDLLRESWQIKGFAVTKKGEEDQIGNLPILSLEELSKNLENVLVVVAVSVKHVDDIAAGLEKKKIRFVC